MTRMFRDERFVDAYRGEGVFVREQWRSRACYSRRTSRVSVENKRHVVYTSTDDPIEIARPFLRLNEWDFARKEGRIGGESRTNREKKREREWDREDWEGGWVQKEGEKWATRESIQGMRKKSRRVSLVRWLRLGRYSISLFPRLATKLLPRMDSMTPQRGVRNWLCILSLEKKREKNRREERKERGRREGKKVSGEEWTRRWRNWFHRRPRFFLAKDASLLSQLRP